MISKSIINYFKSLKYVFTPLGLIALGFVFGLSISVPIAVVAIKQMCLDILNISGEAIDFNLLVGNFVEAVRALDWSDIQGSLQIMLTKEWWLATFEDNIHRIIGNIESYVEQIKTAIGECIGVIFRCGIIIIVFVVLAFIGAYFLTKSLIRHDIAKREFWKFIISTLLGSLLSISLTIAAAILGVLWTESLFISVTVSYVLTALFSLITAYLIHGYKIIPFKRVVNAKNVGMLLLSELILFLIPIAMVLVVSMIFNPAVGIFIALGLICVTMSVIDMNAEAYVKDVASKWTGVALFDGITPKDLSMRTVKSQKSNNKIHAAEVAAVESEVSPDKT